MPLINCKVELKLRWSKLCVLSVAGTDNANGNNDENHIIFTIKDTKLYIPVAIIRSCCKLISKRQSKLLSNRFEKSVYWNEHKTKNENKNTAKEYRYFLKLNFVDVSRLFVLIYTNEANNAKRFDARN